MPNKLVVDLTKPKAESLARNYRKKYPGAVVVVTEQDNGLWAVRVSGPDEPDELVAAAPQPAPATGPTAATPATTFRLGSLSAVYESRGAADAIGHDDVGGYSYGTYQIAAIPGTLNSFLNFLDSHFPRGAKALRDAGGDIAALKGEEAFKQAWKLLAQDSEFNDMQHDFIKSTHYDRFAVRLRADLALDLTKRSNQLKNVAWSVAVQHGPSNKIFRNALWQTKAVPALNDRTIINAVYDERSKVEIYFKNSNDEVKASVRKRFARERSESLRGL